MIDFDWLEEPTLEELARETAQAISQTKLAWAAREAYGYDWAYHAHAYGKFTFYAGSYDAEDFLSERTGDWVPGRLLIKCPTCQRKIRPLTSSSILAVDGGSRWCGLDHREFYTDYIAVCGWCTYPVLFTTHISE